MRKLPDLNLHQSSGLSAASYGSLSCHPTRQAWAVIIYKTRMEHPQASQNTSSVATGPWLIKVQHVDVSRVPRAAIDFRYRCDSRLSKDRLRCPTKPGTRTIVHIPRATKTMPMFCPRGLRTVLLPGFHSLYIYAGNILVSLLLPFSSNILFPATSGEEVPWLHQRNTRRVLSRKEEIL